MKKREYIYYKIYKEYKEKIFNNELKKGDRIESERDMALKYDVSRNTIRKTLDLLERDGLIYKVQGKGNIVSNKRITQNLNFFYSFHDQITSLGKTPSSKVVYSEIIKSDDNLSNILGVKLDTKLYHFKRLRMVDKKVMMIENTYIPVTRFKKFNFIELNKRPMYDIFKEDYNVKFSKAEETLKTVNISDEDEIKYLKLRKNTVCMEITRTTYEMDKVIEYTISHVKPNEFEYKIELYKF